jgi:hypothetical protein
MKLAEPIINPGGVTLMPAGIRLTPMFILRLKKWNIESLEVFVSETSASSGGDTTRSRRSRTTRAQMTVEQEEFARAVALEVHQWFANVRDNELMTELRNVAVKRLVRHGVGGMLNVMRRDGVVPDAPETPEEAS